MALKLICESRQVTKYLGKSSVKDELKQQLIHINGWPFRAVIICAGVTENKNKNITFLTYG